MKLDRIADRDARAKTLLAKDKNARAYIVMMELEQPGWKGAGIGGLVPQAAATDVNGFLQFADRPQDAPILHFGGPLAITPAEPSKMRIGRATDVMLAVGSPGLGAGTHTYLEYEGVIPASAHPTMEFVFPPIKPGDPPIRKKYELKERC